MKSLRRYRLGEFIASCSRERLFIKIHWNSGVGWMCFKSANKRFKHLISNAHFVKMVRDLFFRCAAVKRFFDRKSLQHYIAILICSENAVLLRICSGRIKERNRSA